MRWLKILAVQCVVVVLLLEGALRVYNPLPFRLSGDDIALPVGLHYTRTNAAGPKLDPVTIHTRNGLGFRGPELPADFASRLSIVAVGGSTTECFLLSDGKTWPDVMAAELAKARPNVWVNNAGFDGHSTLGHIVLLRSVLVKLQPKVVLFLAGINDVEQEEVDPSGQFGVLNASTQRLWHKMARHSDVANTILNLNRLWRARHLAFTDQPVDFAALPHRSMTEGEIDAAVASEAVFLNGYERRLSTLVRESRAARIEPVLLTQPALIGEGVDPSTGVDLSTIEANNYRNGRAEWRRLQMYNDVMRRVAERHGVFLVDLANRLPKDSRYFYDFHHFSNDGARAVGHIVAAELGPHLAKPRPQGAAVLP